MCVPLCVRELALDFAELPFISTMRRDIVQRCSNDVNSLFSWDPSPRIVNIWNWTYGVSHNITLCPSGSGSSVFLAIFSRVSSVDASETQNSQRLVRLVQQNVCVVKYWSGQVGQWLLTLLVGSWQLWQGSAMVQPTCSQ